MKNYCFFLLLLANLAYAQPMMAFTKNKEVSFQFTKSATSDENLKYSEIQGTPYFPNNFILGKAMCCNETVPMRYDMYSDQIEYNKDGTTFILEKKEPYTKIIFNDSKTTLVLENINNTPHYFILLADGNNSLLKKASVKIQSAMKSSTALVNNEHPAYFQSNAPVYYIKTPNKECQLIKNTNDILEIFPEKKDEIKTFLKSNKIKFSKEEDLISVINFVNTL
jgi:RecG-like helicase